MWRRRSCYKRSFSSKMWLLFVPIWFIKQLSWIPQMCLTAVWLKQVPQHHENILVINRKLILIAPKLWFGRTHVVTINQGLEEVGYWQHNAPERADICLSDKHFGQRKNQVSAGYAFEVCLYCFFQIKETGAFVVAGLEECEKRSCHFVSLYPLSYWFPLKKARTVFTGKAKLHYLWVLCYLEVVEVKKTNGLWWNGATLKPKKPRVFDHLTWSSYI